MINAVSHGRFPSVKFASLRLRILHRDVVAGVRVRIGIDVGIQVASSDRSTGYIAGAKGAIQAQIFVLRQADGSVRVQLDLKGPLEQDPGLSDRFSRAYDRYMGR